MYHLRRTSDLVYVELDIVCAISYLYRGTSDSVEGISVYTRPDSRLK
jgi:hypothetical protein